MCLCEGVISGKFNEQRKIGSKFLVLIGMLVMVIFYLIF